MASATRRSWSCPLLPALGLAVLSLASSAPEPAVAEAARPTTDLGRRLLESLESDRDAMKRWTYIESAVLEKRATDGMVRSRTNEVYEIFYQNDRRMKRPISLDLANDSDGFATMRREEARFLSPGEKGPATGGAVAAKEGPFEAEQLLRCFRFGEAARESTGGRAVLRLHFTPVDGCLDDGSRAGRLLQNLGGTIWVDERDSDVVKIEGTLLRPVSFGFGLLGRIDDFRLEVDRQALADGPYAMIHVDYRARGSAFIFRHFDVTSIRDRSAFARQRDERPLPQARSQAVTQPDAAGTPAPEPR